VVPEDANFYRLVCSLFEPTSPFVEENAGQNSGWYEYGSLWDKFQGFEKKIGASFG
jgi:hypothetical protein